MPKFTCWRCGESVEYDYKPKERVYCEGCKPLVLAEHKELVRQYADLKRQVMIDTAIRKMERAGLYMDKYLDIAKSIKVEIDAKEDKFLSADEIVAAMVLQVNGIEYEANKRVANYTVDFYIPSKKVCLEIDGDRHESNTIYDSKRDIVVRNELGPDWEVVRIKTNYLGQNPERLIKAIDAIYKEKKKLRMQNGGIIPEHFSRREKDLYAALSRWKKVPEKRWNNRY